MAAAAAGMISGVLSSGFDYLYPIRVAAIGLVLWIFRKGFSEIRWVFSGPAILIGGAVSIVWLALARSMPGQVALPAQVARMSSGWTSIWLMFRTVGYVITGPVADELAFRGYLPRRIVSADFLSVPISRVSWLSLAVSSGLFAAFHGRNWVPGLLAGILFFWAFRRRGRILDAI
jgi:CAAX prenyl protease-like protein